MSNENNNNQNHDTDRSNEKYFFHELGDDAIPDFVNMADYSGKDAKSHLHLLAVIEMCRRNAERKFHSRAN